MGLSLRDMLQPAIDQYFALVPQKKPSSEQLANCKIVAHRGAQLAATENTIEAFELCLNIGVWAIEFDVRFTQDNVPIILHDAHAGRNFQRPDLRPDQISFAQLRKELPQVPSLEEVVQKMGQKIHFMIELKTLLDEEQQEILQKIISPLEPQQDYHFLSLKPAIYQSLVIAAPATMVTVAEWDIDKMSERTLAENWGGFTGHYLLLREKLLRRHQSAGQKVGVGFIASKNSLYREIHRGVDWIFTNDALEIVKYLS